MQQINNTFTTYELTEKEAIESQKLTSLQVAAIQNLLAQTAEEKMALELDPNEPQKFLQQEASLKGQMDAYRHILSSSEAAYEVSEPNLNIEAP